MSCHRHGLCHKPGWMGWMCVRVCFACPDNMLVHVVAIFLMLADSSSCFYPNGKHEIGNEFCAVHPFKWSADLHFALQFNTARKSAMENKTIHRIR